MTAVFQCGRFEFSLPSEPFRPIVMGILNVTPDSFSDGGKFRQLELALDHAQMMIDAGVDIIDIGGESSRPGAQPLSLQQELDRVMPVVYALKDCGVAISVDTYKPEVMREVIAAGADMINDIRGFQSHESVAAVADSDVGLCVMHMQNTPEIMQKTPVYEDVVSEVNAFFTERVQTFVESGIALNRIALDPGFGFGKTLQHNVELFKKIPYFIKQFDLPLLIGVSRKSMIGGLTGRSTDQRLAGSLAGAIAGAQLGAAIVRVHDVPETIDALKVMQNLI
ncbi:dihydropteroate synthase [Undibacterium luofuense]|uniref:Dihydropteroate synthase n=1 Tax=Undibacterium luofuense TaxID=2828733 RepID=A0A941DNJ0_9BURK|nr:dihydropteroate synthase [Undibacterium luofuense]MBR7782016.1 dihydropteroate synthase [Undibacterium luofuense]